METFIVVLKSANIDTKETVVVNAMGGHVEHGVLLFTVNGRYVASFAPGEWKYYVKQNKE